jgi:hypothetical protein
MKTYYNVRDHLAKRGLPINDQTLSLEEVRLKVFAFNSFPHAESVEGYWLALVSGQRRLGWIIGMNDSIEDTIINQAKFTKDGYYDDRALLSTDAILDLFKDVSPTPFVEEAAGWVKNVAISNSLYYHGGPIRFHSHSH